MTNMSNDYLKKILTARVYDVAQETPLELANTLSQRIDNRIYFKREDMQSVFSFKLRGAYNKMAHLTPAQLKRGVICASAGNHAQGVALSAARLGCRAVIVMPTTTPQVKIDAVKARGGEVVLFGDSFTDAYEHALTLEKKQKLTFVHPFDDPYVIAGQGTVGMEILRQHPDPIHAIFVAIGGGGLIAGVASYVKAVRPDIKIIGVQTTDSDAMARSLKAGRRVALPDVGLFSDGTAVKLVGEGVDDTAQGVAEGGHQDHRPEHLRTGLDDGKHRRFRTQRQQGGRNEADQEHRGQADGRNGEDIEQPEDGGFDHAGGR